MFKEKQARFMGTMTSFIQINKLIYLTKPCALLPHAHYLSKHFIIHEYDLIAQRHFDPKEKIARQLVATAICLAFLLTCKRVYM